MAGRRKSHQRRILSDWKKWDDVAHLTRSGASEAVFRVSHKGSEYSVYVIGDGAARVILNASKREVRARSRLWEAVMRKAAVPISLHHAKKVMEE